MFGDPLQLANSSIPIDTSKKVVLPSSGNYGLYTVKLDSIEVLGQDSGIKHDQEVIMDTG